MLNLLIALNVSIMYRLASIHVNSVLHYQMIIYLQLSIINFRIKNSLK